MRGPNLYKKTALRTSMRFISVRGTFCPWNPPRGALGGTFGLPTVSLRSLSESTWRLSAFNVNVVSSSVRQRPPRKPSGTLVTTKMVTQRPSQHPKIASEAFLSPRRRPRDPFGHAPHAPDAPQAPHATHARHALHAPHAPHAPHASHAPHAPHTPHAPHAWHALHAQHAKASSTH